MKHLSNSDIAYFLEDGIKLKAHSEVKPPLNFLKSESVYSVNCGNTDCKVVLGREKNTR